MLPNLILELNAPDRVALGETIDVSAQLVALDGLAVNETLPNFDIALTSDAGILDGITISESTVNGGISLDPASPLEFFTVVASLDSERIEKRIEIVSGNQESVDNTNSVVQGGACHLNPKFENPISWLAWLLLGIIPMGILKSKIMTRLK